MPGSKTTTSDVPETKHTVKLEFETKEEAFVVGTILQAILGKQYGTRQIPKGCSVEDYVNYKTKVKDVGDTIVGSVQPGFNGF